MNVEPLASSAAPLPRLDYPIYDADSHLYETADAFMRHLPKKYENEFIYAQIKGRTKLIVGGMLSNYIPNPTFEVVAAPGVHEKFYRAQNTESLTMRELSGKPIPVPEAWRTGKGRLELLDEQGIHATLVFPTLASVIEERLGDAPDAIAALFHSLNQWMDDEWGLGRSNRIFPVPMINLSDIDLAVKELNFLLERGARVVGIRPAAVPGLQGSRSPGLPEFDPFWARVNEAKIFVCLHASDSGYDAMVRKWTGGARREFLPFENDPFKQCFDLVGRPIMDTLSALICHGVFDRFPDVRVASVENGAHWVGPLIDRWKLVYGQMPKSFKRHPVDTFHRHIFVAPFYEDSAEKLAKLMPYERILFGSDFPHPEGLARPLDYIQEFESFDPENLRKVMSSNLKGLLEGARN
jgi:predicted TIM-barrel fold metal-dependent hydrolase